jgi:hypothetical protein
MTTFVQGQTTTPLPSTELPQFPSNFFQPTLTFMCIHVSGFIPCQSMASSPTQSPQREYIPVVIIDNKNNFMDTMFSGNNLMQPVGIMNIRNNNRIGLPRS